MNTKPKGCLGLAIVEFRSISRRLKFRMSQYSPTASISLSDYSQNCRSRRTTSRWSLAGACLCPISVTSSTRSNIEWGLWTKCIKTKISFLDVRQLCCCRDLYSLRNLDPHARVTCRNVLIRLRHRVAFMEGWKNSERYNTYQRLSCLRCLFIESFSSRKLQPSVSSKYKLVCERCHKNEA